MLAIKSVSKLQKDSAFYRFIYHQKSKQSNSIDIHNNHLVDQKYFDTVAALTPKKKRMRTTTECKFLAKMAIADLCTAFIFSSSLEKLFSLLFQATIYGFSLNKKK